MSLYSRWQKCWCKERTTHVTQPRNTTNVVLCPHLLALLLWTFKSGIYKLQPQNMRTPCLLLVSLNVDIPVLLLHSFSFLFLWGWGVPGIRITGIPKGSIRKSMQWSILTTFLECYKNDGYYNIIVAWHARPEYCQFKKRQNIISPTSGKTIKPYPYTYKPISPPLNPTYRSL